ncbi:hypothetical protein KJ786_03790 [Patescibacteria group bacterium]|nr:hypothetical protein [Patescibacteria group bacterium]
MKRAEKIEIAILIILIIIWIINIWVKQKTANPKISINCDMACHQIGNVEWFFPGPGPISQNTFSTQEDCISACQAKFKK